MALPHSVTSHPDYISLSPRAIKALIDIGRQYNSNNNGDLSLSWKSARERGWTSKDQLGKAIQELLEKNLILKTRQGGRHCCNLFALTWYAIDECKGKLECAPTSTPPRKWSLEKSLAQNTGHTSPAGGAPNREYEEKQNHAGPRRGSVNGSKTETVTRHAGTFIDYQAVGR